MSRLWQEYVRIHQGGKVRLKGVKFIVTNTYYEGRDKEEVYTKINKLFNPFAYSYQQRLLRGKKIEGNITKSVVTKINENPLIHGGNRIFLVNLG